jgi:hypothetical protein
VSDAAVAINYRRDALGGLDLLVNNTGVEAPFALVDMPLEEWEKVIAVNLTGVLLCTREAARIMRAADARGAIVMISSVHEVIPWMSFSHYCASKGGVALGAIGRTRAGAAPDPRRVDRARRDLDARALGRGRRRRASGRLGRLRPSRVRRRHDDLRRRRDDALTSCSGSLTPWTTRA